MTISLMTAMQTYPKVLSTFQYHNSKIMVILTKNIQVLVIVAQTGRVSSVSIEEKSARRLRKN